MMSNDALARKKVQSVIKGWLETIEQSLGWQELSEENKKLVRRGLIRASWASYKIGLFTNLNGTDIRME
jgi:hypothetical protein